MNSSRQSSPPVSLPVRKLLPPRRSRMTIAVDRSSALRTRLFGSKNRVAWSSGDIERVLKRFGVSGLRSGGIDEVVTASRRPILAVVGRRFVPSADANRYEIICSTSNVDRMGDIIEQGGW